MGQAALMDGTPPTIQDYAYCMHTAKGKRMKRGVEHFVTEATKLVPKRTMDPYQVEAKAVWLRKHKETPDGSDEASLF